VELRSPSGDRRDKAMMQILSHQKEQIDTLNLAIKAAQDDKLHNKNRAADEALAANEAKRTLDEKYNKKHAKSLKKIKLKERKRRKQFAEEVQYYNMLYNNPQNQYNSYAGINPRPY
jgi:Spy/CpxP family protein refolding chaperone